MHTTHPEGALGKYHELLCSHGDHLQKCSTLSDSVRLTSDGVDRRLSDVKNYNTSEMSHTPALAAPVTGRGLGSTTTVFKDSIYVHTDTYRHITHHPPSACQRRIWGSDWLARDTASSRLAADLSAAAGTAATVRAETRAPPLLAGCRAAQRR